MHLRRATLGSLLLTSTLLVAQQAAPVPNAVPNATSNAVPASTSKRPHIVVIVCDDAGYADFSVHGATDIRTPRIDSIARDGVRFAQGYVSGTVCSPTRAGLLTGRYQQRFGHEHNIPPQFSEQNGLPVEERTFADDLKAAGYRTIALGKWHLGYADHFHPLARGFDHYYGFLQGQRSYWPLEKVTRLNRLLHDREVAPESFDYLTDELGRAAAKYIVERGDEPLFLYLAFNAVHGPMQATEQDLQGTHGEPRRRKLIAMTHALDRAVGYVLDALEQQNIADDTMLCFVNDNGGATNNASQNAPLRGHKGQVFEGGMRVPFLLRWPNGGLPKGVVYEPPVIALDLLPTSLAAAGVAPGADRALDGVNLLPFLRGETKGAPHEALFWRMGETWAVRVGDHKLVHQQQGAPMLFDVVHDVAEQHDLAADQPELATSLQQRFAAWAAQLAEPRWGN